MKKYGIVVVTYDNSLYKKLDNLREIIFTKLSIPIFFIYNGPGASYIDKNTMYVSDNNMNPTMYNKFIIGCNYLLQTSWTDIDYIVRVNSSTFLNPEKLLKDIQTLPALNCYAGSVLFDTMISGLYIIFSKDVILKIIQNGFATPENAANFQSDIKVNNLGIYEYDDVLIGQLMHKWNIKRTLLDSPPYYDKITSIQEAKNINYLNLLKYTALRIKNTFNRDEIDTFMWTQLTNTFLNQNILCT